MAVDARGDGRALVAGELIGVVTGPDAKVCCDDARVVLLELVLEFGQEGVEPVGLAGSVGQGGGGFVRDVLPAFQEALDSLAVGLVGGGHGGSQMVCRGAGRSGARTVRAVAITSRRGPVEPQWLRSGPDLSGTLWVPR